MSMLVVSQADPLAAYVPVFVFLGGIAVALKFAESWLKDRHRGQRRKQRQTFYRVEYLKSDDWRRKQALVLKRDQYRCVYCGVRAKASSPQALCAAEHR
jgi:hypothetical protein